MVPAASANLSDSPPPLPPPPLDTSENNVQPFYVLHKAQFQKKDRKSNGQGKGRKRNDSSLSSPKKKGKLEESRIKEFNDHGCEELRIKGFKCVWSKIESTTKDVLRDMNTGMFKQIYGWVRDSFNDIRSLGEPSFGEAVLSFPVFTNATPRHLFTGFVITKNMEFVDDILTFEELKVYLESQGCHVAKLSSPDFLARNGVGFCLKALLKQFLKVSVDAADISVLASWYREQGNYETPLVLIINDLDRCCGSVLSDFILMLCEWVVKVPIILIMGVATMGDAPRNIVPSNVLQHLYPCKFMLGSPAEKMAKVVEAVLVKQCSRFTVGHKVALFLRNHFMNQDGTLVSFIRALKIACFLHFLEEPLSIILGLVEEDCKDAKHGLLPEVMMKYVSELPSYLRNQQAGQTGMNLGDGLSEMIRLQNHWSTGVSCLYEAGKYDKVQLSDLFCEVLDPHLHTLRSSCSNAGVEKCYGLSSSNDLQRYSSLQKSSCIYRILRKVRDLPASMLAQLLECWEKLTADDSEIHVRVKACQSQLRFEDVKSTKQNVKDVSKRHASRSSINIEQDPRLVNSQVTAFIEGLIRDYVMPVECIPFHEVMCFKNVEKLRLALIGDPRKRIQADLMDFQKILKCSCCNWSSNALSASMHDSSIMYSLAQEHGDLINLHDWYQSFRAIINNKAKRKNKSKNSPQPKKRKDGKESADTSEASIQARFCRAVIELQIAGLIRMPSKRRPDFVQRVAFGL